MTERTVGRIAQIEGPVMYARGAEGKWAKALVGISLLPGDRIDTRTGLMCLDLDKDETAVYANRNTMMRLLTAITREGEVTLVDLTRGEVYIADGKRKVHVLTRDGLYSPVGTHFDIKQIPSATIVAVEQGAVRAQARAKGKLKKKGGKAAKPSKVDLRRFAWVKEAVRVGAGQQSRVRHGETPSKPSATTRKQFSWIVRLAPERMFADRLGGPLLYSMRAPGAGVQAVPLPDGTRAEMLRGWTCLLGGAWTLRTFSATGDDLHARYIAPHGPTAVRSHAIVGRPSWQDYEVVLAFRVLPGTANSRLTSLSAIAYQGARPRDLYRLGVWYIDAKRADLMIVRNYDAATQTFAKLTLPYGVQSGTWYRMRFAVQTQKDRIHMTGKIWPATQREPDAWTIQATDRAPRRLVSGIAGVGLQNVQAEFAEFAVHQLK